MSKFDLLLKTLINISISGNLEQLLELMPFDPILGMYRFGGITISRDMVDSIVQNPKWCLENWVINGEPLKNRIHD